MAQLIKPDVLQKIKEDENLILDIAQFVGKRFRTVYQWVLDNSEQLQTPAVLQMVKSRHGYKSDSEILEKEESEAAA
jgi:hypothetical protein